MVVIVGTATVVATNAVVAATAAVDFSIVVVVRIGSVSHKPNNGHHKFMSLS